MSDEFALRLKEQGNSFYRDKKIDEALACWGSALGSLPDKTTPLSRAITTIRSNAIMAYLSSGLHVLLDFQRDHKSQVFFTRFTSAGCTDSCLHT